jgi:hypothetical protein
MDSELNMQVTRLKVQAKNAGIDVFIEMKENLVMVYQENKKDFCGSIGYLDDKNMFLVAYIIDLNKLRYAQDEGFSKDQIQKDKRLNILKEVRPEAIISHLI